MSYTDKTLGWGTARTALVFLLITLLSLFFFGGIGFSFVNQNLDITSPNGMRWLQFSVAVGLFLMPPLFFAQYASSHPTRFLGLRRLPTYLSAPHSRKNAKELPPTYHTFVALALVSFGAFFAVDALAQLVQLLPDYAWVRSLREQEEVVGAALETLLFNMTPGQFLANLLVMVALPAFGEELFFRGVVQKLFHRTLGHKSAIVFTALFFALAHQQPLSFLPIFAMGIILGALKLWTGSLWAPILVHFINNAYALLTAYMNEGNLEATGSPHLAFTAVGLIALGLGLWWLRNIQHQHTAWLR